SRARSREPGLEKWPLLSLPSRPFLSSWRWRVAEFARIPASAHRNSGEFRYTRVQTDLISSLMSNSLADFVKDLQQLAVRLDPLGVWFKRAVGLGQHQRIGAPLALQGMLDVAGVLADHADQMLTRVFAGRNASDLVGGVGQKRLELGAELARASNP